jgi:flagellar hook assembly protein FlgD
MVEHSVNTGVEQRLQVLEKREQAADLVTATLKSIDGRVSGLVEEVTRAGFNIHELAGHVQIKLLTREEARLRTRMLDAQKEEPRP